MLREVQGLAEDFRSKYQGEFEPTDWVSGLTVTPFETQDSGYGALIWTTNYSLSCAATTAGLDRLLSLAHTQPNASEIITYLASRPMHSGSLAEFSRDQAATVYFDRRDTIPAERVSAMYLGDLVRLLPVPECAPTHLQIMDVLDKAHSEFPFYS